MPVRRKNPVSYHRPCRHRTTYGMSCDEFEQLYAEANGACQICEIPGHLSTHGILVIDHDNAISFKAVRGLLCAICNSFLGRRGSGPASLMLRYVRNAWHLTHRPELEPIRVEVPDVPRDEALALLRAAVAACSDDAGKVFQRRADCGPLIDAVRIATKAGIRQRFIVKATGNQWTREKVYQALHVDGCKVAGSIRTRDEDLVAAAARETDGLGFTVYFNCTHPDGGPRRPCAARFAGNGTYATALKQAEAAAWQISPADDRARCPRHSSHIGCADRCLAPAGTTYEQLALFAA